MVFIFDMDGVIVDNHNWHFEAWVEFGRRHGLDITLNEFRKYFGSTNQLIMNDLFGKTLTPDEVISLGDEKESIYRELYSPFIKPVEGIPDFLRYTQSKSIPMALATSAPYSNVKFTLEATGLTGFFSAITDSSMVSYGKPDPQVYLITATKLGVKPSECIVFEDSFAGIQSAINAGMHVVGVATTHKSAELLKYVNEIIMNFGDSKKLFNKLLLTFGKT